MEIKKGELLFRINGRDILYDSNCSFDENCRYVLNLSLAVNHNNRNKIMFILKNPSTATHKQKDIDNTLKRLVGWTYRKNIHNFTVCNVYAFKAKTPQELKNISQEERIGKENNNQIKKCLVEHEEIILGLGEHKPLPKKDYDCRIYEILQFEEIKNKKLFKIGECTKEGYPNIHDGGLIRLIRRKYLLLIFKWFYLG